MAKNRRKSGAPDGDAGALASGPKKTLHDGEAPIAWLKELMQAFCASGSEKYHSRGTSRPASPWRRANYSSFSNGSRRKSAEKRCRDDAEFRRHVGEELADVLMYCVSLANAMDFDIAQTVAAKMEKNRRKYPADKGRRKLRAETRRLTGPAVRFQGAKPRKSIAATARLPYLLSSRLFEGRSPGTRSKTRRQRKTYCGSYAT